MLQKQPIPINFAKGLDLKSDPFQVQAGNFLTLENSVFTTAGRLTKRNGFNNITTLPNDLQSTLTTLNGNLIATGSNLYAFSEDTNQWLNQGTVQPVQLNTLPLVRVSTSQTSPDTSIAPNGLICLAYMDSGQAYYQVSDSTTGQQIVKRTALPATAVFPRVFVLGVYFIVAFLDTVSGSTHLQYIAIPLANPNNPRTVADFATNVGSISAGYDGVVVSSNNQLYIAYSGSGTSVKLSYLTAALAVNSGGNISSTSAELMSVVSDPISSRIFMSWYDGTNLYSAAFNYSLVQTMAQTTIATATIEEVTSVASNGLQTVFYETENTYAYDSNIRSDYVSTVTCSLPVSGTGSGTVGATTPIILMSVALASKAFIDISGIIYVMVAYGDTNLTPSSDDSNQPTYFLIDSLGNIYMRLAYSNGGGYPVTQVLPSISYINSQYHVAYLNNDFLASVNKGTNLPAGTPTSAIYTQTGVNLASFGLNTSQQHSVEIAGCLNLTGGMLWEYDGVKPVENNFQVWPENIKLSGQGSILTPSFTGITTSGSPTITSVSSFTNLAIGMPIYGYGIPANTTITALTPGSSTITISANATESTPTTFATPTAFTYGNLIPAENYYWQFTYEWTNNQGNLERSAPSIPITLTPLAPSALTGNVSSGSPIITSVSSFTGVQIGQVLSSYSSSGSFETFPIGSYIISFNETANTITVSENSSSAASGVTFNFAQIASVNIDVPTDRLTYKIAPNPIRIVGYRWSDVQEVYYQFTSLTSPTLNNTAIDYVSFFDGNSDAEILGNVILYTTGSVVEDISPPASIDSALFDNRLWLIDAEDQNLLWFSKQVIEDVPIEMSDLLTYYTAPTTSAQGSTGTSTAIYPMDDKLIVFKKDAAYYINGTGPDNTGSNSQYPPTPIFITSAVGCANPNSIVLTPNGLMFQSDKGIWLLGRDLSTNYIGSPVESYNNLLVLSATAVPATTQVRFILEGGTTLMYDYFFNQWATHTNILAISSTLYQGEHTYLNSIGQVYQEAANTYTDGDEPVLMSLTTSWINLSGLQGFERFYFANLLGTYFSPFMLTCNLAYNYNPSPVQSILVTPDNYTFPWGGEANWGSGYSWGSDQTPQSGSQGNIFSARLFPEIQKCQSFQLSIQEVYDPSLGVLAGQGLSLSGMLLVVGSKKGYRTQSAGKSFG